MRKIKNTMDEQATFVIEVKFNKNGGWQGTIHWLEKRQTSNFRSELEFIKLIDSAEAAGHKVKLQDQDIRISI